LGSLGGTLARMHSDFWIDRWKQGQTGFHQSSVNPALLEHWGALGVQPSDRVFVPLCGKSLDLLWLRERGHSVLGVELSPIAVRDFFREAALVPTISREGPFEISEANGIRVLQGDFFDLSAEDLAGVRAVYDRAALIALPPNLRIAYARALAEKLPRPVAMLLLGFESRTPSIDGPPFCVGEEEIRNLYEPAFRVDVLHRGAFAEAPPNLRSRGHELVADMTYLLTS
jgi:thiopurine S-methyltransferase